MVQKGLLVLFMSYQESQRKAFLCGWDEKAQLFHITSEMIVIANVECPLDGVCTSPGDRPPLGMSVGD